MANIKIELLGLRAELDGWIFIHDSDPNHANREKRLRKITDTLNEESRLLRIIRLTNQSK